MHRTIATEHIIGWLVGRLCAFMHVGPSDAMCRTVRRFTPDNSSSTQPRLVLFCTRRTIRHEAPDRPVCTICTRSKWREFLWVQMLHTPDRLTLCVGPSDVYTQRGQQLVFASLLYKDSPTPSFETFGTSATHTHIQRRS